MSETGNYLGGSLGFGLLGAVAAVVYHDRVDGTSDSLAGAIAAARHLPAGRGADVLHTAREAFIAALHVIGLVAAVLFAALAVLVLLMRPVTGPGPAELPAPEGTTAPEGTAPEETGELATPTAGSARPA